MCNELKQVETHEYIQWLVNAVDWTTAELVCFCSLLSLLLMSSSLECFLVQIVRTLHWLKGWQKLSFTFIPHRTRMCHLVVSAVPDLFDTSIHFLSFFIISPITLLFLLPDTFNFHDVVDKYPAHFRWGPWHSCRVRPSHRFWAQRLPHHGGYSTLHPGILGRECVPERLRVRWRHHRQGALFTTVHPEREDDACRGQACHSQEEGLSSSLSSSVSHDRTVRPVVKPFDSQISSVRAIPSHSSESEQIRILLERQREQILADCQAEIRKHEFQAYYDRRSIQKLSEMIESQKKEICRAHQGGERLRRDQQLLHEQFLKQNWDLREAHEKSLNELEELKRFQGSTFDTIARRKLIEDRDTLLELTGKIQEFQNEINCMNDSRDFQDAESVRSGHSHVTSQPVSFPPHPIPGGMLSRSSGDAEPQKRAAKQLGIHMENRETFLQIQRRLLQHLIRKSPIHGSPMCQNTHHHMWWVKSQTPVQDQRYQSGPSVKNSVIPGEGECSKNYGADQQRLQISDLHFDKFSTPATLACWKIRFKTVVCTCSQFPTEAMQWIKEVELVDSVDDLKSSCSARGIRMPDFEVLDAKIASALNRIIHNTQFKRRISLEEQKNPKRGPFLSWKTDCLPDLRVLPGHWGQRFCRELCRPIHYWSSKWRYSGIRFKMGRNSIVDDTNPIWWHLGRIVQTKNTRIWETQDRIGIVQYGDSSEESWTWLSQIENNGEKKYRAEFTN